MTKSSQPIQLAPVAEFSHLISEMATLSLTEWADLFAAANVSHEQFVQVLQQRINPNEIPFTVVAVDGQQLLGYGSIKESEPGTKIGLTPWLAGMYVKQEFRGNGIGSAIVRHLEQKALDLGFSELFLSTDKAASFYQHLGWQTVERIRSYSSRDVVLMRKQLV